MIISQSLLSTYMPETVQSPLSINVDIDIHVIQWSSIGGILPSSGLLVIAGDIFGSHTWGEGALHWHLVSRVQRWR